MWTVSTRGQSDPYSFTCLFVLFLDSHHNLSLYFIVLVLQNVHVVVSAHFNCMFLQP